MTKEVCVECGECINRGFYVYCMYALKPSLSNALLPSYMKAFTALLLLFTVFFASSFFFTYGVGTWVLAVTALFIVPLLSLGWKLVVLRNTVYRFKDSYVEREFSFIVTRNQSVPFANISKVFVDISLWDRFCNAGDVRVHVADDSSQDLVLEYVERPQEVKEMLYDRIN